MFDRYWYNYDDCTDIKQLIEAAKKIVKQNMYGFVIVRLTILNLIGTIFLIVIKINSIMHGQVIITQTV